MKPERVQKPSSKKTRKQWKPTAFEKRVEARLASQVSKELDASERALTEPAAPAATEQAAVPGPTLSESSHGSETALAQARRILKDAQLENDPEALRVLRKARGEGPHVELRLLGDLADLQLRRLERPAAKASHVIQPSGGGVPPAPDLRADYEKRVGALRPGDLAGLLELKREFRKRGLQVY